MRERSPAAPGRRAAWVAPPEGCSRGGQVQAGGGGAARKLRSRPTVRDLACGSVPRHAGIACEMVAEPGGASLAPVLLF